MRFITCRLALLFFCGVARLSLLAEQLVKGMEDVLESVEAFPPGRGRGPRDGKK